MTPDALSSTFAVAMAMELDPELDRRTWEPYPLDCSFLVEMQAIGMFFGSSLGTLLVASPLFLRPLKVLPQLVFRNG